jgi:uncharacterized membrane protein YcgQ (UPF0703/DUF1980 family)
MDINLIMEGFLMEPTNENRVYGIHCFIKAAILFGFFGYILYLVKTDSLAYYIAPRMQGYVKWSSLGLYIVGMFQVYIGINSFWGKREACDCEHLPSASLLRNFAVYGLFVAPLLLGFLLPNVAMSSALADKKGMNLTMTAANKKTVDVAKSSQTPSAAAPLPPGGNSTGTASIQQPPPLSAQSTVPDASKSRNDASASDEQLKKMFAPPDKYSEEFSQMGMILYTRDFITVKPEIFMETLSTIDMFKNHFLGKKIELSGFVYREDDLKPDQLVVEGLPFLAAVQTHPLSGFLSSFPMRSLMPKTPGSK